MQSSSGLPLELIHEIAESLCLHCTSPPTDRENDCGYDGCEKHGWSAEETKRVSTLASLCLTSRGFSKIATPHLYHCPTPGKWWLLARTLITAKVKAQHVRQLQFGDFDRPQDNMNSLILQELSAYSNERLNSAEGYDPEDFLAIDSLAGELHSKGWGIQNSNDLVDLVTALCPNVEYLQATLGYFATFYLCKPNSLMALKHLDLRHADTEGGIHITDLTDFLRAAPNLTTIRLFQVDMETSDETEGIKDLHVTLNHVKYLDFWRSAVGAGPLGMILRACPNLETLDYEAGGGCVGHDQFSPVEAKEMILRHAPNLRTLRLDLRLARLPWRRGMGP
jgi:hypothetical protein